MSIARNSPRYNEWILVRRITVAGFSSDADWVGTQDANLSDGAGNTTAGFQVPNLPGRVADGFSIMMVGVDADGEPVAPGAGTLDIDVVELVRFSGEYNDRAPHVAAVEDLTTALTALSITLPANLSARLAGVGGSQNQFALRVTALTAPAGAAEVRILVKPLGA